MSVAQANQHGACKFLFIHYMHAIVHYMHVIVQSQLQGRIAQESMCYCSDALPGLYMLQ